VLQDVGFRWPAASPPVRARRHHAALYRTTRRSSRRRCASLVLPSVRARCRGATPRSRRCRYKHDAAAPCSRRCDNRGPCRGRGRRHQVDTPVACSQPSLPPRAREREHAPMKDELTPRTRGEHEKIRTKWTARTACFEFFN
jgi:hypothetical protein